MFIQRIPVTITHGREGHHAEVEGVPEARLLVLVSFQPPDGVPSPVVDGTYRDHDETQYQRVSGPNAVPTSDPSKDVGVLCNLSPSPYRLTLSLVLVVADVRILEVLYVLDVLNQRQVGLAVADEGVFYLVPVDVQSLVVGSVQAYRGPILDDRI